jgi:hypothetical protein
MRRLARNLLAFLLVASLAIPPTSLARAAAPRSSAKTLYNLAKLRFQQELQASKTRYWFYEQAVNEANRKAERYSQNLSYHVVSTYLFLGTLTVMAVAEEAKKQAILTGEPPMSTRELLQLSASWVANDGGVWAGFFGNFAAEKALSVPMGELREAVASQSGKAALGRLFGSTAYTTVAFFGWTAAQSLLRMACRLDPADLTVPGGGALTDAEAKRVQEAFLSVFVPATSLRLPGMSAEKKAEIGESRRLVVKVLRNMYYILFLNDELGKIFWSATVRLFLTGDMLLFTGALVLFGSIGGVAQRYVPIPYLSFILGFGFSIAGATAAHKAPSWMKEGISDYIWANREVSAETDEERGLHLLDLVLSNRTPEEKREKALNNVLVQLREARESKALVVLERINALLQMILVLQEDNRTADDTIEQGKGKISAMTDRSVRQTLGKVPEWATTHPEPTPTPKPVVFGAPETDPELAALMEDLRRHEEARSLTRRLDLKERERALRNIQEENRKKTYIYGARIYALQKELRTIYDRQLPVFNRLADEIGSDPNGGWKEKILAEVDRMTAMNDVLIEISDYLGWGGVTPKSDTADAKGSLSVAAALVPILVFDGVSELRLDRLLEKTTRRYLEKRIPDPYEGF